LSQIAASAKEQGSRLSAFRRPAGETGAASPLPHKPTSSISRQTGEDNRTDRVRFRPRRFGPPKPATPTHRAADRFTHLSVRL